MATWKTWGDGEILYAEDVNKLQTDKLDKDAVPYVRPEDYGAKGDGTTDDTAAVQAAVNACLATTDEPKMLVVAGQYRLTSSVNIDRAVTGDGQFTDFRIVGMGTRGGFYISTAINMFSSTLVDADAPVSEFINFENVYFEGPDSDIAACVLNGDKFLRIKFTGCRFFRVKLLVTLSYIQSIYLNGCTIKHIWGNFFDCALAYDVSFSGNLIEVVTGNVFRVVGSIVGWTEWGATGCRFIDNLCEACLDTPIVVDRLRGCSIIGNYFEANVGATFLDLCVGTHPTVGAIVSGNMFIMAVAQYSDATYFPIRWGPTITAFSSGNFSNGRLHDLTDAAGVVSHGDYAKISPGIVVLPESILVFKNIGDELVTNGGFGSDASEWTPTRCTLASVAGGQVGNCLEITYTSGLVNSAAHQDFAVMPGEPFSVSGYIKTGTSGNGAYDISVYESTIATKLACLTGSSSGAWVLDSDTFTNPIDNMSVRVYIIKNNTDAGTMLFDEISVKQLPPVSETDCFKMYSSDIAAGNVAPHFRTENGTIIKLDQAIDTTASPSFVAMKVGANQVVGAQGAAVADATDAASVILRLNDLLARTRAHGLIAT